MREPFSINAALSGTMPPKGWDVGEACEDGWSRADITEFMKFAVVDDLPAWTDHVDQRDGDAWIERAKARAAQKGKPMERIDRDGLDDLAARGGWEPAAPTDQPLAPSEPPTIDEDRRALVEEWVFLTERQVFRHVGRGEEMKVGAFDLKFQQIVPEMDHSPAGTPYKTPKQVSPSQWHQWYGLGRSAASDLYLPQQPAVFEMDGKRYVNSYLPALVPSSARSWRGHWAAQCWAEHLANILPDDWPLLLGWLAHNTVHPGIKILWAPIIKGVPGDGKTSISKMLGAVMGAANVKVVSTEAVFSDFNGFSEGSCVAFLEELRAKGHSRHDVMTKLKPLISNAVIEVVRKGRDGRNVPNTTNYLGLTNHEDALVLDADDRRWAVMFTRFKSRAELVPAGLDAAYFNRLHAAIEQHPDVLRAWLLDVDLSAFDPNVAPPVSAAKRVMISNSLSADAMLVAEMIALGREGVGKHAVAGDCLNAALKADNQPTLATSRMPPAFDQLGWRKVEQAIKWDGKTRRVYIDMSHPWPEDEALFRIAIRDELDATSHRARAGRADFSEIRDTNGEVTSRVTSANPTILSG